MATAGARYPVLAARARGETIVERSRFVATADRCDSIEVARAFVAEVERELGPATHHCFAFVVGPPGSLARVGHSDAGEPHGTAGRPMLDVLLGSGIGDVAVVVSRWFGGVKLGTGGLARAYGDAVKRVLESAVVRERIDWIAVRLRFDYDKRKYVDHVHPRFEVEVLDARYAERVEETVRVPREALARARDAWRDAASGRIEIDVLDSRVP